jgi:hypothetical protein
MAIIDSGLSNTPTTGLGDSLLLVNIGSSPLHFSDIQLFSSASPDAGVTVVATPEPGTLGADAGVPSRKIELNTTTGCRPCETTGNGKSGSRSFSKAL